MPVDLERAVSVSFCRTGRARDNRAILLITNNEQTVRTVHVPHLFQEGFPLVRRIYQAVVIRRIQRTFRFWQWLGIHVVPNHYYHPVPDTSKLDDRLWSRPFSMKGIEMNDDRQVAFLKNVCLEYKNEYDRFGLDEPADGFAYYTRNKRFGAADGDVLYSMVRHLRPSRVIEVGFGWSTYLTAPAVSVNHREKHQKGELIAIDPYPKPWLKDGSVEISEVIEKPVQHVDLSLFTTLQENDILFLDPTHAFLAFNDIFEVLWGMNHMLTRHPEACAQAFRTPNGSSLWLRKVK